MFCSMFWAFQCIELFNVLSFSSQNFSFLTGSTKMIDSLNAREDNEFPLCLEHNWQRNWWLEGVNDQIIICQTCQSRLLKLFTKASKSMNLIMIVVCIADIYEEVSSSLQPLGLDTECLGGGRIAHNPSAKPQIKIYGYSQVRYCLAGSFLCF